MVQLRSMTCEIHSVEKAYSQRRMDQSIYNILQRWECPYCWYPSSYKIYFCANFFLSIKKLTAYSLRWSISRKFSNKIRVIIEHCGYLKEFIILLKRGNVEMQRISVIFLDRGDFHLKKVVISYSGAYLESSGTQNLMVGKEVCGPAAVNSFMNDGNYIKGTREASFIEEVMEQLRLKMFLQCDVPLVIWVS